MKNKHIATVVVFAICLTFSGNDLKAATVNVTTSGFTFVPSSITIDAGDTVIWNNLGGFHSVTGDDPAEPLCGEDFPSSCTNTFLVPGSYAYHCIPHGGIGMTGIVHVVAAPIVKATLSQPEVMPDGTFRFTISSTANRTNVIEASTNTANPANWSSIATLVPTNTPFLFIDSNATSFPLRFYRLVQPD